MMLEKFKTVKRIKFPAIAKWELTACLTAGKWAQTFRARPASQSGNVSAGSGKRILLGDYILKLPTAGENEELAGKLLEREAKVAGLVSHEHLLPVLDYRLKGDRRFLVQPYLPGTNLEQVLATRNSPSPAWSLWIARQIAGALIALHEKSISHCDLAPRNITVTPSGHSILTNLGLADVRGEQHLPAHQLTTSMDYLAPEQLDGDASFSPAVDVYALGGIAFQLITGQLASRLEDRTPEYQLLHQALRQRGSGVRAADSTIDLILSTLHRKPASRPTAAEIEQQLWPNEINLFAARAA